MADGDIWGRGALDDKSAVFGLLEAAESLLERRVKPRRTVIFSFGHTEEGAGAAADHAARLLESRHIHPWFVMDEGGALGAAFNPVELKSLGPDSRPREFDLSRVWAWGAERTG